MMNKIELSAERINEMFTNGEAMQWARNVIGKVELSEEEMAFSAHMDDLVKRADKLGSTVAREEIAEVVLKIVEDEIYNLPFELLGEMFDNASYGEFDKIKVRRNYKNTLVAHESAARTGSVQRSYIDFEVGTTVEKHLQIETEIRMSDLRRDGAVGIATLSMMAAAEFEAKKYAIVMDLIDNLLVGGDNVFTYTGSVTKTAFDDFTSYVVDNSTTGEGSCIGLSNIMRTACRASGVNEWYSSAMKDELNAYTMLQMYNGVKLNSISPAKKTGKGETLLPVDTIIGFAGKIGELYSKGDLRVYTTADNSGETISLKFTGYEFGVTINKLDKIAKLKKTA